MSTIAPVVTPRFAVRAAVPGVLLLLLALAYTALLPLAPSLADQSGIAELAINGGERGRVVIPGEALDCAEQTGRTVCSVDVLDRELRVVMTPGAGGGVQCSADYAGSSRDCVITYYSYASPAGVALSDGLALTREEFDRVAAEAMPWWRFDNGMPLVLPVVLLVFPLAAALVVGFGGRRRVERPGLLVAGIGVGWFALHVGLLALLGTNMIELVPPVLVVAALVTFWQWTLTRPGWRTGWGHGITAFLVTTVACFVSMFVFLVAGLFVD
ncbi:hypothetical protein [Actinokineospora diospyrosa]|uniref:Uncharacterized protein n=1 Tax=Actinokineospora diospyrosa TaxID=103728 RepID=A0ABT1II37_9PSEU|nr:hypothetical protein [Actinokineospora diospyrosa]MCP2272312.1 hypothetical protein [Actinokineospora diospyrosa]